MTLPGPRTWHAPCDVSSMPQDIERGRLQQLQANGAQVVEVLPHEEFNNEHLPGAINMPLAELGPESTRRLDTRRAVVVYCQASD